MIDTFVYSFGIAILSITLYQIFISDKVMEFMGKASASSKEKATAALAKKSVAKIAQVKLISDNAKDIEKFIVDNAESLDDQTVKLLVERLEAIKADKVISGDNLARRIDSLEITEPSVAASRRA